MGPVAKGEKPDTGNGQRERREKREMAGTSPSPPATRFLSPLFFEEGEAHAASSRAGRWKIMEREEGGEGQGGGPPLATRGEGDARGRSGDSGRQERRAPLPERLGAGMAFHGGVEEENGFRTGAHPKPVIQGARGRWRWGEGARDRGGNATSSESTRFRKAPLKLGRSVSLPEIAAGCGAREGPIRAITRARQRGPPRSIRKGGEGFRRDAGG